jgi:hypothetical protein
MVIRSSLGVGFFGRIGVIRTKTPFLFKAFRILAKSLLLFLINGSTNFKKIKSYLRVEKSQVSRFHFKLSPLYALGINNMDSEDLSTAVTLNPFLSKANASSPFPLPSSKTVFPEKFDLKIREIRRLSICLKLPHFYRIYQTSYTIKK